LAQLQNRIGRQALDPRRQNGRCPLE